MEKVNNWVTKKTVLFSAIGIFGLVFVVNEPIMFGLCKNIAMWESGTKYCNDGSIIAESVGLLALSLSLSLIFLSLITYWMKEQIFRAWIRFAYWWIPLTIIMTYLSSGSSGGGFGIPNVFDAGFVLFVFSFLFFVISLIIIIYKTVDSLDKKSH